jgi:hypothetical protein
VVEVPLSAIPPLIVQTAALQTTLAARLARIPITREEPAGADQPESERLLTPPEPAALLGVTVPWLYRHARGLPFARRLSP